MSLGHTPGCQSIFKAHSRSTSDEPTRVCRLFQQTELTCLHPRPGLQSDKKTRRNTRIQTRRMGVLCGGRRSTRVRKSGVQEKEELLREELLVLQEEWATRNVGIISLKTKRTTAVPMSRIGSRIENLYTELKHLPDRNRPEGLEVMNSH